ncbi:TonB-dependent receptor [Sinomicrobium weinanense]|uniref:Carboxypeptidase regulatory-like domain-containing protein n=1 Tax=Sinomicrobium weinanense TaxID=2842200 RepID=A0A926JQM9_9FLAO|nr:TonB-dependent receptor [Sinomicrobium weinanense]MBC9795471.1 carboxypeptidase regulatory-like domain-containing protein [Sinomicrobium weinanense]MBU3123996.1 TonB-dependent receptor [Sinomicrobium weinanense]
MKQKLLLFFLLPYIHYSFAQTLPKITGRVMDLHTRAPLKGVNIRIEGTALRQRSGTTGKFALSGLSPGHIYLHISADGYLSKTLPVAITDSANVYLGDIFMEPDMARGLSENPIIITENDLADDESGADVASGILQAARDVYLQRAAFDLSQAFFKVRGYDSREGIVMINGIPMNKIFNGRPQWNNWGGLNDVTRNQELSFGLSASPYHFGGVMGSTNISMRASEYRPGLRVSASASNRFYNGRFMATYSSGLGKNGLAYSVSASRRWAEEAYMDGTLYDAWSLFGAVEYKFNDKNSIQLMGIFAPNRRGSSAAVTEEVFELAGRTYNPYWGKQDGKIRNSRERRIEEPMAVLSYFYEGSNFRLSAGAAWQSGKYSRGRLGYYNAPNPDPVYYRYLPGFYINSPSGANFESANLAREGFRENPQIDWNTLYLANTNPFQEGKSAYILYDDTARDTQLTLNTTANIRLSSSVTVDAGATYRTLTSENYAYIRDLLGGEYHEDKDPFTDTANDLNGDPAKHKGDKFNYDYTINAGHAQGFVQLKAGRKKWKAFLAGSLGLTRYQREGHFLNERFGENSLGKSKELRFSDYAVKGGIGYYITGRHIVHVNGGYISRAPTLQNAFVNPRENNEAVKGITSETMASGEVSYLLRFPELKVKLNGYYTRFGDVTDVNFFYVDAGVGSDFVQETVTGIEKRHLGGELGISYQASPEVKLSAVAAYGEFTYTGNADVAINFDTAGREEDLINPEGFLNLGETSIKDYNLATGPQQAYSFGIEYRDPGYWWVGMTANHLAENYADISIITRTDSFYTDPDTGEPFPGATEDAVAALLKQEKLDNFYLLNLTGGKSWLIDGKYIGVFISVNNVFDQVYRTGGYEQSRNGNFGQLSSDMARGMPSFGPKYWYGFGRTYFLNIAVSF